MSTEDVIRAWREQEFRDHLSGDGSVSLPPHPAGEMDISDIELDAIGAGLVSITCTLGDICVRTITLLSDALCPTAYARTCTASTCPV